MRKNKLLLILLIVALGIGIGYGYKRDKHFNETLQYIQWINDEVEVSDERVIRGFKLNNIIYVYENLDKDHTVDTIFWDGYREISKGYSKMYFDNSTNREKITIYHIYGNRNASEIYYVSMNGHKIYDYYDGWEDKSKNKIIKEIMEDVKENNVYLELTQF